MGHEFDLHPPVRCSSFRCIVRHPRGSIAHSNDPHTVRVYPFPSEVAFHDIRPEGWQTPVVFAATERVGVTSWANYQIMR